MMARYVALLRAVNVGGRSIPMSKLRAAAEKAGFVGVESYIQSGNLLLSSPGGQETVSARLEKVIRDTFGIGVTVIVRSAAAWKFYLKNPFPGAESNRVVIGLSRRSPRREAAVELEAKGESGERVLLIGDALWFHYPQGQGRSKLTPARVDKAAGSPTTARNLNTVRKLADLLGEVR